MKIPNLGYENFDFCAKHDETQNHKIYLMFSFKFSNPTLNFSFKISYKNHTFFKHDKVFIFLSFFIDLKHNKTYIYLV